MKVSTLGIDLAKNEPYQITEPSYMDAPNKPSVFS